jgi:hypothetical protein
MLFLRTLFDFSKPRFLNLDSIDIVVEDKLLFLVSWKAKRHHKIKIDRPRRTYHNHETAIILKLSPDTRGLTITLESFWRKNRYTFQPKKIKLDKETAQHLIRQFKPVEMLSLNIPIANSPKIFRDTNIPVVVLKNRSVTITAPFIYINTDKLTYTAKTNNYEQT